MSLRSSVNTLWTYTELDRDRTRQSVICCRSKHRTNTVHSCLFKRIFLRWFYVYTVMCTSVYMYVLRASVSGLTVLLVLWFFIKSFYPFIHSLMSFSSHKASACTLRQRCRDLGRWSGRRRHGTRVDRHTRSCPECWHTRDCSRHGPPWNTRPDLHEQHRLSRAPPPSWLSDYRPGYRASRKTEKFTPQTSRLPEKRKGGMFFDRTFKQG